MLAVGAGLHHQRPCVHLIQVDQRHRYLGCRHAVHQCRYRRRNAGAPALGVEVAQPAVQREAVVARLVAAQHQAGEGRGQRRVGAHRVVRHAGIGAAGVGPHPLPPPAQLGELPLQRRHGVVRVGAVQEADPLMAGDQLLVRLPHRPEPHRQGTVRVGLGSVVVPAGAALLVAVVVRVEGLSADHLGVGVHPLDHPAPSVHVGLVAGGEQGVAEGLRRPFQEHVAVDAAAAAGVEVVVDGEPPAVGAAPPLAVAGAAQGAVQAHVGGNDAAVGRGPLTPGVHVLHDPVAVLGLAGDQVGVERQGGGLQVEGVVAHDVGVLGEVRQHLPVAVFLVSRLEAALDLDRVAGPVQGGGLAQQRSAAAIEQTADHPVAGIVVPGDRVLIQVEAGIAPRARLEGGVVRGAQPLQVEGVEPLAVVPPVEHHRELLEVHAVAGEFHLHGPGLGVLPQVSLPGRQVAFQHYRVGAEGI